MPDERSDPLADLFTLFASPLSGTVRSIEQFRRGVDEFLKGVENFNRAMANLNETTERINSLLIDVEQPIRAAIPQVTRTVKAADDMMQVVSGPAMAVAPGLARLAETLATPAFAQLPHQIGTFSDVLDEVSRRLAPLTQLAESAGGLFGFRIPGSRPTAPAPRAPQPRPQTQLQPERPTAAPVTTRAGQRTAKKVAPRKQPAKKATASASSAGKSSAKKSTANKSTAKKSTARKSTARKSTARKSTTGR